VGGGHPDPTLIQGSIDETLRYDPSVPVWRRLTKHPVTIAGFEIPEGAKLFLWLAAAGREPTVFSDPDRFDMPRDNAKHHLAFGKGMHFCIGSALGKLEARLALEALTTRSPASGSPKARSSRSTRTSAPGGRRRYGRPPPPRLTFS